MAGGWDVYSTSSCFILNDCPPICNGRVTGRGWGKPTTGLEVSYYARIIQMGRKDSLKPPGDSIVFQTRLLGPSPARLDGQPHSKQVRESGGNQRDISGLYARTACTSPLCSACVHTSQECMAFFSIFRSSITRWSQESTEISM